jgi:tetratricopeptide (TPR) repeat protein
MAMPRRTYKPKAVTSMVFWSDDLYSVENLKKAEAEEQDTNVKAFIGCLIFFRGKLKENNPCYDNPAESPEVNQFLKQLDQIADKVKLDTEFLAAILNLKGLALLWIKNYADAYESFRQSFASTTNKLTWAIAYSHMGVVLKELRNETYLKSHITAGDIVDKITPLAADIEIKKSIASIYCLLANAYRKQGLAENFDKALATFDKAINHWESSVIANNRAILLSKVNTEETLELAEEYLAKAYPGAKEKQLFVVPFYRADVAIKLAAIRCKKQDTQDVLKLIEAAGEYIETARKAIVTSNYATSEETLTDYQNKALARLFKLDAYAAFILGNLTKALEFKNKAIDYRNKVKEDIGKTAKFVAGIDFIGTRVFTNPNCLFRYPMESTQQIEAVKTAVLTSNTSSIRLI